MACVRAEHRKALHQAGCHGRAVTEPSGGDHVAVQAATWPGAESGRSTHGQAHFKTNGVAGAVHGPVRSFILPLTRRCGRLGGHALHGDGACGHLFG